DSGVMEEVVQTEITLSSWGGGFTQHGAKPNWLCFIGWPARELTSEGQWDGEDIQGQKAGESISMHEHGPKILQQRARKLQRDADRFPSGGSMLHRSHWEPANHDFQVLPESANKTWSA
ncbi:hypothetical protein JOQ06_019163, partial [Pogonophryne albipinna]